MRADVFAVARTHPRRLSCGAPAASVPPGDLSKCLGGGARGRMETEDRSETRNRVVLEATATESSLASSVYKTWGYPCGTDNRGKRA